jgi:hypothetical protein
MQFFCFFYLHFVAPYQDVLLSYILPVELVHMTYNMAGALLITSAEQPAMTLIKNAMTTSETMGH